MNLTGWSERILAKLSDPVREDLAQSLATAIELHFGLVVTPSEAFASRGAGGWCDGVSIIDSDLILYRPTPSRRENFTLMHELGHHLIDDDIDCLSWIADQPQPGRLVEQLCDKIAADVLVPKEILDHVLGQQPPDAASVVELYESTEASRSACAIAISRRLPCDGFVLLVENGAEEVFFATRARETRPYAWRGDLLPGAHPLRKHPTPTRALTWWPSPTGNDRREYYMSTAESDGWTVAVFAENNLFDVPGFHIPQQAEQYRGYGGGMSCPCGYQGTTPWWPCKECNKSQCPKCQECDCRRRASREQRGQCQQCFTSVRAHLIVAGLCDNCR